MKRFILLSFVLMAWGYWEMSGGAAFVPQVRLPVMLAATDAQADPLATDNPTLAGIEIVTRADTTTLEVPTDGPGLAATALAESDAILTNEVLAQVLATPEPQFRSLATPLAADLVVGPAADPVAPALPDANGLREVAGDRVNMREGPGRDYGVIDQLTRGMLAQVLEEDGFGWVRVRVEATGQTGWMSVDFLSPING